MNRVIKQGTESVTAQSTMTDVAFLELCAKGTAEEVRQALESGANIVVKDDDDMTTLMWAAKNNTDPAVITVLLDAADEFNEKGL